MQILQLKKHHTFYDFVVATKIFELNLKKNLLEITANCPF